MFLLKTHTKKEEKLLKIYYLPILSLGKSQGSRVRAQQPGIFRAAEDGAVLGKLPVRMMGREMD